MPHLATEWYLESLPAELFADKDPYARHGRNIFASIDEIVEHNWSSRPIYFDYSSSHALMVPYPLLPNGIVYKVKVEGDKLDEDIWNRYQFRGLLSFIVTDAALEELRRKEVPEQVWLGVRSLMGAHFTSEGEFLKALGNSIPATELHTYQALILAHTFTHPPVALDSDIERTFVMYGSARVEMGNIYLDFGSVEKASEHFNAAVRFDPSLGDDIVRMLQFRDSVYGGHVPQSPDEPESAPPEAPDEPQPANAKRSAE